jgi:hypothetical protein
MSGIFRTWMWSGAGGLVIGAIALSQVSTIAADASG